MPQCVVVYDDKELRASFKIAPPIEIEIVYNMYRMRRFYTESRMRRLLSLGSPNYAIQGTYKSGLDR
jgi:hypothetical protein